jgi:hypothetical protein
MPAPVTLGRPLERLAQFTRHEEVTCEVSRSIARAYRRIASQRCGKPASTTSLIRTYDYGLLPPRERRWASSIRPLIRRLRLGVRDEVQKRRGKAAQHLPCACARTYRQVRAVHIDVCPGPDDCAALTAERALTLDSDGSALQFSLGRRSLSARELRRAGAGVLGRDRSPSSAAPIGSPVRPGSGLLSVQSTGEARPDRYRAGTLTLP